MDFFLAKWVLEGRILILLDYRFLQNDPELHILLAEMCLQAVMQLGDQIHKIILHHREIRTHFYGAILRQNGKETA